MSETPPLLSIVTFHLGAARFGVRSLDVREVVRAVALTPVADAPEVIEGIFDLRGVIVPVLNLRKRFGLPPKTLSADEHLLIVAGPRPRAFRADRVVGIDDVPEGLLQTATSPRVAGVARTGDGLSVILDLDAFLDEAEIVALDAALDTRAAGPPT